MREIRLDCINLYSVPYLSMAYGDERVMSPVRIDKSAWSMIAPLLRQHDIVEVKIMEPPSPKLSAANTLSPPQYANAKDSGFFTLQPLARALSLKLTDRFTGKGCSYASA